MFAYCGNDPVIQSDAHGQISSFTNNEGKNGFPGISDLFTSLLSAIERAVQMGSRADVSEGGISFNFEEEYDEFCEISDILGTYNASMIISASACIKYNLEIGNPFLLSDRCVAWEYYQHVLAYQWAVGDRDTPNYLILGWTLFRGGYDAESVFKATRSIDIRIRDVVPGGSQAIAFFYWGGIRDCYIDTEFDPWRGSR